MSDKQRTKGPWRIDYDGQISTEPTETDPHSQYICGFRWDSFKEFNEGDEAAVARLIRSAPNILKALEDLHLAATRSPVMFEDNWELMEAARDAIIWAKPIVVKDPQ